MFDRIWIHARAASFDPMRAGAYGLIEDAAIASLDGRLAFVGPMNALPAEALQAAGDVVDLDGALVTPGLIDCHTHLVFAGDRAGEFEARLAGASYAEIAAAGGGIASTVRATRAANLESLIEASLPRLDALIADGATTVEIKSGYGLDLDTELRLLEAAGHLGRRRRVRIVRTLLAAHAVPPEFAGDRDAYVDLICERIIPTVAARDLAEAVDAYGEHLAFTPEEVARVFAAAKSQGLAVKLHADQLSDQGGGALAARFAALSADHLEYLNDAGVEALAEAGCVAVLLPGAFVSLRETQRPPIEALRRAGVALAVATDANPGTSPLLSPRLAASLACLHFDLNVEEALAGLTREAARALGLDGQAGVLREGLAADLAIWDAGAPSDLLYWMGVRRLIGRAYAGEPDSG